MHSGPTLEAAEALRKRGLPVLYGDATRPSILKHAHLERAGTLVIAAPGAYHGRRIIEIARSVNRDIDIVARTHSEGSTPNLHVELQLLVDSVGMSPLEAIRAATQVGARALGMSDSLGTLTPGKKADLVILNADPSLDIANTMSVLAVMKAGRLYERPRPMVPPPGARRPREIPRP